MAWIEKKQRRNGGVSARVVWRLGGTREGAYQSETFGAGSDAQNLARADGFKKMVDATGQRWPDGWVREEGFVRPRGEADPLKAPPRLVDIGEEYVRQIVDVSPGQRKRYLGHLRVLAETRVRGALIFTRPVTSVHESDLKDPNGLVARAGNGQADPVRAENARLVIEAEERRRAGVQGWSRAARRRR